MDLVDVLGNFQDAVDVAKEMAAIDGDVSLVYPKKNRMELWETFLEGTARSVTRMFQGIKPQLEYKWGGFYSTDWKVRQRIDRILGNLLGKDTHITFPFSNNFRYIIN